MCCVFFSFFSHSVSFYLSRIDHLNSHLKFVLYNIFGWYHRNKNNKILIESFTTSCYIPKSHFYTDRCDVILRLKVYSIALIVCVFLLVLSPGDLIESAENVRRIQWKRRRTTKKFIIIRIRRQKTQRTETKFMTWTENIWKMRNQVICQWAEWVCGISHFGYANGMQATHIELICCNAKWMASSRETYPDRHPPITIGLNLIFFLLSG